MIDPDDLRLCLGIPPNVRIETSGQFTILSLRNESLKFHNSHFDEFDHAQELIDTLVPQMIRNCGRMN